MSKRIIFFVVLVLCLFPSAVMAQEYDYHVNNNNWYDVTSEIRNLTVTQDDTINIYIDETLSEFDTNFSTNTNIYFADGNINVGEFYLEGFNDFVYDVNIYFGTGNYRISELSIYEYTFNLNFYGQGRDKTTINTVYSAISEGGSEETKVTFNDLKFNNNNDNDNRCLHFYTINSGVIINNCDFTGATLEFDNYDNTSYINNSLLSKVIIVDNKLYIDCNSSFNDGIKIYDYNIDNDISENEATIIYKNEGKAIFETCKNKSIKMTKKMSLKDIKDELGYEIDNTWSFNPEGIVEIKEDSLVPIKVGKTSISKEINGEIQTLRVEVLPDQIVNPKTSSYLIVVIVTILISVVGLLIVRKKNIIN